MNRRNFLSSLACSSFVGSNLIPGAAHESFVKQENPPALLDPDAPLKIGVIGQTGHLGYVLDEFEKIEGAKITAYAFEDADWEFNCDGTTRRNVLYNLTEKRNWLNQQPWAKISAPVLYVTYQEMFAQEDLDLVCIFLPYSRNAYAIRAAAEAGVHVLSEKPVAVSFEDLKMVETAVNKSKIRLSAMFALRYAPTIFTIRRCVASGMIGIPQLATAQKSYKWGDSRPWFYKHREIFGSTILWVGIHAVDYIRWCCGLEVLRVSGFHSNLSHSDYPGTQDNVSLALEMEGGRTASMTMDFLRPGSAPTHGDDRLRIAGSQGIIETRNLNTEVELLQENSKPRNLELASPRLSLFAEYVSELRGQGTHLISNQDAIQVTRICIAATEAANTGTVVGI